MSGLVLRPYQRDAVDAVWQAWRGEGLQRVAGVAATGAGKTIIFCEIAVRAIAEGCHRVLILVHRDELLEQALDKLRSVAPGLRVGAVAGARNDVSARVIVASVQTLARPKRLAQIHGVGLVIVDECHHATASSYRTALEHFGCHRPGGALALGVTATMERGDGAALGDVWQDIVFEIPIAGLVRDGWLVKPRAVHVRVEDLDLDKVKSSRGDFADGALGKVLSESMAPDRIVEAIQEHAQGAQGILFAPTVAFAELMAQRLDEAGLRAALVTGAQHVDDRRKALQDFRDGTVRWLTNCMVLTEGTDLPMAQVCCVARPTRNPGLFVQMVGRVLRPWPGKSDALVLDVVGVSKRHRLASLANLDGSGGDDGTDAVGTLEVDSDNELLELALAPDEVGAGSAVDVEYRDGRIVSEYVELFDASHSAWNQTRGGVWFLAAGDDFIAILPDLGGHGWMVVRVHPAIGHSTGIERGIPDMSYAMAHGEANVSAAEMMTANRGAAWRRRAASTRQIDYARALGVDVSSSMKSGELSDLISVHRASARLDHRVGYAR